MKLNSPSGRYKAYAIVYDKNGDIKVDDWESLPDELKQAIEEELKNGRNLSDDQR
jgi:ribosome maturation factor RimP